jgi:hypothetical protein
VAAVVAVVVQVAHLGGRHVDVRVRRALLASVKRRLWRTNNAIFL